MKKGYKPTYESCGGAKLSSKNGVNILKLACQYGLESEEATKLFVQSKDPEIMEILVKEGKADVCKYPIKKIQEWYDTPDTIRKDPDTIEKRPIQKRVEKERPVYREERNPDYWNKGGNGLNEVYDGDRGWEPHYIKTVVGYESYFDYETVYEDVRHEGKKHVIKNNEGAMPAFKKLVKLGYKPETPVDAKAFTYMAEKLNKIIAEKKRIAEENAKYEAEQKRRDSEIEKIGDCPLGQKLLAAALIKAGIMNDHSQVDSMENVLTNDFQRKELKKLRQKEIISEKFEILKPYEFSQSEFFTDRVTLGLTSIYQVQKVPMINTFRDKAEKQH
ncbi:MAG: hypothetical protein IJ677_02235, partial [Alphaproteobacteria bacterium]|nr:hypothetical protein [Alphaproteobacteria bacterium]